MISCKGSRTAAAAGIPARAPALAPPSLGSLTVFTLLCLGCIWGQETTVHDMSSEKDSEGSFGETGGHQKKEQRCDIPQ